jgi:RNA polymerase sigma-70 factor (ECF subfamily)
MNGSLTPTPNDLLQAALKGSVTDLGRLLEYHRQYLALLARLEVGRRLQAKVDASDLVQETLLEAHRGFDKFRGTDEAQFSAWLRQIMAAGLSNLLRRYYGTQARDVRLERDLASRLDQSSRMLDGGFIDQHSSPSHLASRHEQAILLANALAQLPEDYREVLVLRHIEELSFPEIARRMDRSLDSVEKLWVRGLVRLRQLKGGEQ